MLENHNARDKKVEEVAQGSVRGTKEHGSFLYEGDPAAQFAEFAVEDMKESGLFSEEEVSNLAPVLLGGLREIEIKFRDIYFKNGPGFQGDAYEEFDKARDDVSTTMLTKCLKPGLDVLNVPGSSISKAGTAHLAAIAEHILPKGTIPEEVALDVSGMSADGIAKELLDAEIIKADDWFLGDFKKMGNDLPSNEETKAAALGILLANTA